MIATGKVKIKNALGIHCRPSAIILRDVIAKFPNASFELEKEGGDGPVRVDNMMSLMSLGMESNNVVTVNVDGSNAQEAKEARDLMIEKLEFNFDFQR